MTDELERLRAALRAETPAPDADIKARQLRAAQEIFTRRQEMAAGSRPVSESRPMEGWLKTGARRMLDALTSRGALAATTALVAAAVVIMSPATRDLIGPGDPLELPEAVVGGPDENLASIPLENAAPGARERDRDGQSVFADQLAKNEADFRPGGQDGAASGRQAAPAVIARTPATDDAAPAPMAEPQSVVIGRGALKQAQTETAAELSTVAPGPEAATAPPQARRLKVEREIMPVAPESDTEAYANAAPNPLKVVAEEPVSTFSIDVDTASYTVIRSSLTSGRLPPRQAVRVEEMVNYFPYDYAAPEPGGAPFMPTVSVFDTPWNPDTDLVHIALQGEMPSLDDRPPLNLVFLIDTSGSMQDANKLPLLIQSFRLMLGQLRPEDQVAMVTYAGSAGLVLEPTPASERRKILAALDKLQAGGSTAGQAGLQQAYAVAEDMAEDGRLGRVILATDGDFNVGLSDPEALKEFIAEKRDTDIFLSVLGFGRGNLDDATMQALAQNGNGQAAFIDTLGEAQKVLVDQLTGGLFPIAKDVKIQVEFNPATVAEYRLIGYETRALRREDFNNDAVDAGEIGAGHSVTAIYEITPVGSPAMRNDPLRYQAGDAETVDDGSGELGFLRLRYKQPDASRSQLIETAIVPDMGAATAEARFAASIAGFGELLRGSDALGDWSWGDAIALAGENRGDDGFGYRAEAVSLMRLAQSLSQ